MECPNGYGNMMILGQVADELSKRLQKLFLKGADGARVSAGAESQFENTPDIGEQLLFHEYFHGDTGRGLGASHQNGWTGLIALLLQPKT